MNPLDGVVPTPEQAAIMRALSRKLASLREDIAACLPASAYKTEALTNLEIVGMLTNKGVIHGTV